MTLTLELPNDLERELAAEAARFGLPLSEYALRLLAAGAVIFPNGAAPRTGPELVAFWERAGVVGTRTDIADAAEHSRALRDRTERRS